MARKKHVLIVPAWYPGPGQPHFGVFIREQVKALHGFAPGYDVSVWDWRPPWRRPSFKRPGELLRAILGWIRQPAAAWADDADGLHVFTRPVFTPPRPFQTSTRALADGLRQAARAAVADRGGLDLVHAHVGSDAGWASSLVCPELGIPWVLTEHMGPAMLAALAPRGVLPKTLAAAYAGCQALVAVSSAHGRVLHGYCGRQPAVIPNVFDEEFFRPLPKPPPAGAPFLVVAALRPVKGIDMLLRAYAEAAGRQSTPALRIGGDGPQRKTLERLAHSLGLRKRVEFLGTLGRDRVRDEMQHCAALVIASHAESFGVVAIEAMGCRRPVLATACGGPQDIVVPETGILVRASDTEALSAGLIEMARRWADFDGAAIRRRAETHFGRAAVAAHLCGLYDSILHKPAGNVVQ